MTSTNSSLPWWRTDDYTDEQPLPKWFDQHAGPMGVGLVKVNPNGTTDSGWGLVPGVNKAPDQCFMPLYLKDGFNARRALYAFEKKDTPFAVIMRSVSLVSIDIDGKNGGLEFAKRLGMLPMTAAETSKSGDGFHLFYTVDDTWDPTIGFGVLGDRIGIEQGVDFRATGCIYHHPQQRWNDRLPVELPKHIFDSVKNRAQKLSATTGRIAAVIANDDPTEVLMLHDEILTKLRRPVQQGSRNNTMFAIGSEMMQAGIPGWEDMLIERAIEIGLTDIESEKIVQNINRYAVTNQVSP